MVLNTNNKKMNINNEWKNKNKEYLKELQSFLDKADNIENEKLKRDIIIQMLKCDKQLTLIAEQQFNKYYNLGYDKAKGE